jgi:hypothetical protein
MAAFANARGGYLIFGVTDSPRVARGLSEDGRRAFNNLDQAKLTQGLNELFSPEVRWQADLIDRDGYSLAALYTFESENKPVVARKSQQAAKVTEGDIFYRYNSRTERVKFPELRAILDDAATRESRSLMNHIDELLRAGATHAAVLDFTSSTLTGPAGERVLIDEELLKKISFIREGDFDQVRGAPTLKIVGEVLPAKTIALPSRVVRDALTTEDVLSDFLKQVEVGNPDQYIRQACGATSSFLPIQYYRRLSGITTDDLVERVREETTRSPSKARMLARLEANESHLASAPSSSTQHQSTVARKAFYDRLVDQDISDVSLVDAADARHFLAAIRSLSDDQVSAVWHSLLPLMRHCFDSFYGSDAKVADELRRAACRVDHAVFAEDPPSA